LLKKIDRYMIAAFVPPFTMCLVTVYGLYAAFDLLQSLNDLRRSGMSEGLEVMLKYYVYFFPVFMSELAAGASLIAAGLVLVRMSRQKELLVLKASGVSIHRIVMPILVTTVILSGAIAYVRDHYVPTLARRCDVMRSMIKTDVRKNILIKDTENGYDVHAEVYQPDEKTIEGAFIVRRYPGGGLKETLHAKSAKIGGRSLELTNVIIHRFRREDGLQQGQAEKKEAIAVKTSLTEQDFALAEEAVSPYMNLESLTEFIQQQPDIPTYRVIYHTKLSAIFAPVILLLIGIPFILGSDPNPKSRAVGVSICIFVSFCFYVLSFMFTNMGNAGKITPVMAGWLPTILMGAFGLVVFDRMHS